MNFDTPILILLHISAFAFAVSLAFCGFMISVGFMDKPVARSSHASPIPTGAGIGITAGLGAGLLGLYLFYPYLGDHEAITQISALAFACALLGVYDDVCDLKAVLKFFFMIIIAIGCVYVLGVPSNLPLIIGGIDLPYWAAFLGAVLWIFVVMNGVNFMDGANGMMGGVMCIAFCSLAIISVLVGQFTPAILAAIMAASLVGFLPYNARKTAYIFSGDVGALLCGFMYAACSLLLIIQVPELGLLYVAPLLILPFLTDVLITMFVRARHKEHLLSAHSQHMYQRLIKSGHSHVAVSMYYVFASALMGVVTVYGVRLGLVRSVFFLTSWLSIHVVLYIYLYGKLTSNKTSEPDQPHN